MHEDEVETDVAPVRRLRGGQFPQDKDARTGARPRHLALPVGQALAYYCGTNPGMVRQASHAFAEVLADG